MTDFLDRWVQSSSSNAKLVAQEALITEATEALWCALERSGINKSELAERLGTTKGYVSQVLSGSRNMTLRTLSDICFVLGETPHVRVDDRSAHKKQFEYEEPITLSPSKRHLYATADSSAIPTGAGERRVA